MRRMDEYEDEYEDVSGLSTRAGAQTKSPGCAAAGAGMMVADQGFEPRTQGL
jgi:hypothetical protein